MSTANEHLNLSPEHQRFEDETLAFHLENGQNYMRWQTILERVSLDQRYLVVSFGNLRQVQLGQELLDEVHRRVTTRDCSYVNDIQEVDADYDLLPQELYNTFTDPDTGREMVDDHTHDIWNVDHLMEGSDDAIPFAKMYLGNQGLEDVIDRIIRVNSSEGNDLPLVSRVRGQVTEIFSKSMSQRLGDGSTHDTAVVFGAQRAGMGFKILYSLARIRDAGVDLDQHPEYRSHQIFFEMGLEPPDHAQVADFIIRAFADRQKN